MTKISGYACYFDTFNQTGELVQRGAFDKALKWSKIDMHLMHKKHISIGVWDWVYTDERGLFVSGQTDLDPFDLAHYNCLSIGFAGGSWRYGRHGRKVWEQINLKEISLVNEGRMPDTFIAIGDFND